MPSLFEPCGLNQLYSLAHGTVPIVRATGGLVDTVVDANPENLADGTANGFVFAEPSPRRSGRAIERALALWPDRAAWLQAHATGMNADWSWERSAREYVALYEEIKRQARPGTLPSDSELTASPPPRHGRERLKFGRRCSEHITVSDLSLLEESLFALRACSAAAPRLVAALPGHDLYRRPRACNRSSRWASRDERDHPGPLLSV